jgi:hypothetical protein
VAALIDPGSLLAASRRELARLPALLDAVVGDLDDATARTRPAENEWAPVEILCHLRDEETEDFRARVRAVIDGRTELLAIDPVGWVESRRYRDAGVAEVLTAIKRARRESLEFLAGVDPGALGAVIVHGTAGPLSAMDFLAAWAAHDQLHVAQLAGTLARLWANRWPSLKVEYAGPIPYPAT